MVDSQRHTGGFPIYTPPHTLVACSIKLFTAVITSILIQ
jgi:hypothetical protein